MTTRSRSSESAMAAVLGARRIGFGGDYNPEQWPRDVWDEDMRLMREAAVNLVTVGTFAWSSLQPGPDRFDFGWLDEVLDLLHSAGVAVDLATPTASPPPWMAALHPETLPVDEDGVRLSIGSRNHFSPAALAYRRYARDIAEAMGSRYSAHPAVRMWHIGNEFGQIDHGEEAARDFRLWLVDRYETIDALNDAWGTVVWSQTYRSFDEIVPPRRRPYLLNPAMSLDFRRFTSWALVRLFREQRDALRGAGVVQPITTNFMGFEPSTDLWSWAPEVDVIADDQYPDHARPTAAVEIALVQDLMRSLGGGRPWMLMENAIGATSWRAHNLPKSAERARLDSLQAVARGADAVCFFQWRQARTGAERFHSALLPHAGEDTRQFEAVRRLGVDLDRLGPVAGSRVDAAVAILFDWESWWAADEPARPTERLRTRDQLQAWYSALWRLGVAVDLVDPDADLSSYPVVLLPHSYIVSASTAQAVRAAVYGGAHLVIGPFSGVADGNGGVILGRFPAHLRDVVGVSGEEWVALPDEPVRLDADPSGELSTTDAHASVLGEALRSEGARVLATFAEGHLRGMPAVTCHRYGRGSARYLGAVLSDDALSSLLHAALRDAGVTGALGDTATPDDLEVVRRGDALFLLNHAQTTRSVPIPGIHLDLLTDTLVHDLATLPPYGAMVLTERRDS